MSKGSEDGRKIVARNRKARYEYEILDTMEAGIVLRGPEVKSLRDGRINLAGSFARVDGAEVWLHGMHVSPYEAANRWNTDPLRPRKLLLHRKQIRKLIGETRDEGRTLVPLEIYFRRGRAKVLLALGRGKQLHDKRRDLKRREADRDVERAMGKR